MKDDLIATPPPIVFETFPFPDENWETRPSALEATGEAYYEFRAALMVEKRRGADQDLQSLPRPRTRTDPEIAEAA